jgi:hypothetical protein
MRYEFEIQEVVDPDTEERYRALAINGEVFDWGLEKEDMESAKKMCGSDPFLKKSLHGDICRHFITCLSEFLGKEITLKQVNEALEQGYLEC